MKSVTNIYVDTSLLNDVGLRYREGKQEREADLLDQVANFTMFDKGCLRTGTDYKFLTTLPIKRVEDVFSDLQLTWSKIEVYRLGLFKKSITVVFE